MFLRHPISQISLLSSLLLLAACHDSDSDGDAVGGADASTGSSARFIVHSAVQNDDTRTNYFTAVASLDEAVELSHDDSIEVPGRARLYAEEGIGHFAIGNGEDVTITRYELDGDGGFAVGEAISLQPYGVSSMSPQAVLFVSPTKAYYKDGDQGQVIVWNPTEMTVEDTIELPADLLRDDRYTSLSKWASRPGEGYFAVSWASLQFDSVDPGTALVRIDTATDEMSVTRDERCRGLGQTAEVDGSLYFFSDVLTIFGHAVQGESAGQENCILRVPPGETEFDPDYVGSLTPALADHEMAVVEAVTDDGRAWIQVVDTNVAPTEPGTTYGEWYGGGWSWASLDLATTSDRTDVDGDAGAYSGFALPVGSRVFISQTAADYSETTFLELSGAKPRPGVSFPGFALDVAALQ